jgi:hypothetical protein
LPPLVDPIRFALYKGTGPVNEFDRQVGEANCIVKPGKAQCSVAY